MARSAKITLDGTEYEINAFNIGELEDVTDIFQSVPGHKVAFEIVKKALRKIGKHDAELEAICPEMDEVIAAFKTLMTLSGMKVPDDANPPKGAESQS